MIYEGESKIFDTSELSKLQELIANDHDENNSSSYNSSFSYKLEKYLAASGIGDFLDLANSFFSVIFVVFYITLTYTENSDSFYIQVIEISLIVFLFLHYLLRLYTNKNKLLFLFSVETIFDLGSIICLFVAKQMNSEENKQTIFYLNLSRMSRFLYLSKLEAIIQRRFDEATRYQYRLSYYILGIILVSSALILEFENSESRSRNEDLYQFHDILYFMLVTLSTIGFGDIYPKTIASRVTIIITILILLSVVPTVYQKLKTILSLTSKYKRIVYHKLKKNTEHLIITGTCGTEGFEAFLKELYHEDHKNDVEYHAIIMQDFINEELMMILKQMPFASKIVYIMGNSLKHKDLERCKAESANCVVFLANKLAVNAKLEDFSNILQAFAVKKFAKMYEQQDVRVCLQLLRPDTKEIYFSSLLDSEDFNVRDQVICVEEIKLQLLGKSCLCPGINTIISTLITSDKPQKSNKQQDNSWTSEYLEGSQIEIYRIDLRTELLQGISFIDFVKMLYEELGIIAIGVDIKDQNGEEEVCINPYHYTFPLKDNINEEQVLYVLADSKPQNELINSIIENKINQDGGGNYAEMAKAYQQMKHEDPTKSKGNKKKKKKSNTVTKNFLNLTSEPRTIAEAENFNFDKITNHIVICGLIQNLKNLILPLRTNNIKQYQHPILIIDKEDKIPSEIWKEIQYFPDIYYLQGNPIKSKDLAKANIKDAKAAIILSKNTFEDEANDLIDADTIFIYKAIRNEAKNIFILVELSSINTLSFISSNDKANFDKQSYRLTEQYAVGEIYTSSMLDTLMCQSFYNPHITKILQQLIMGNSTINYLNDTKKESKESIYSQSTLYLLNISEELKKYNENKHEPRMTYEEIFYKFLNMKMIPIGIYRSYKMKTPNKDKTVKYVFLCPNKSTMINCEDDKIYVLANEEENILSVNTDEKEKKNQDKYNKHLNSIELSKFSTEILLANCKSFMNSNQKYLNEHLSLKDLTQTCREVIKETMKSV